MNKKLAKSLFIVMWGLVASLLILSIICLSINGTVGIPVDNSGKSVVTDAVPHNGWWLIKHDGLYNILSAFKTTRFSLWYAPYQNVDSFKLLVAILTTLLIIIVPFLSILFGLLTWRIIYGMKYTKTIEHVEAIKQYKKAQKRSKRRIKKAIKKVNKNKIPKGELTTTKEFWAQQLKSTKANFDSEQLKWNNLYFKNKKIV